MRPIHFLALLSVFITLPAILSSLSLLSSTRTSTEQFGPHGSKRHGRFRALFSFTTPSSFFPPSALISLTDDNSTIFLARPAAFGPLLPMKGLSGQLWVGRGFGEDLSEEEMQIRGFELGCSDVPGWSEEYQQLSRQKPVHPGAVESLPHAGPQRNEAHPNSTPTRRDTKDRRQAIDDQKHSSDGTDDYLHYPLSDSTPASPNYQAYPDRSKSHTHADIESLQEGADISGKIVMLSRGGCGFLEKVKWAQRRGGLAVIVGDNQPGGGLTVMYAKGDTSNVTIPSLFTSYNAAHLLSSLVPSSGSLAGDLSEKGRPGKVGSPRMPKSNFEIEDFGHVLSPEDELLKAKHAKGPLRSTSPTNWLQAVLSALGLSSSPPHSKENRKPPSSGNVPNRAGPNEWYDDKLGRRTTLRASSVISTSSTVAPTTPGEQIPADEFVIGVHDWRDTGLILPTTSAGTKMSRPTRQGERLKLSSSSRTTESPPSKTGTGVMPTGLVKSAKHQDSNPADAQQLGEKEFKISKPGRREGLWVTLTPTDISASPFFDSLLVLVVSPLVTLTIVYGLLLLRSRIRRRRWRAPKSIVERLPTRIYHTMTTTSSTTSSQLNSPNQSTHSSPQLRPSSARSRTRSESTDAVPSTSQVPSSGPEKSNQTAQKQKKYTGRQLECVVCLEDYVDGESLVMSLPCGHEFHAECITPWLVTRRRTCPICKGDVVRSFSRSDTGDNAGPSTDGDMRYENEQTSDDVQERVAATTNEEASAAIPIPLREGESPDEDVERGATVNTPLLGESRSQARGWRGILNASVSRLSGETLWRPTPNDRTR